MSKSRKKSSSGNELKKRIDRKIIRVLKRVQKRRSSHKKSLSTLIELKSSLDDETVFYSRLFKFVRPILVQGGQKNVPHISRLNSFICDFVRSSYDSQDDTKFNSLFYLIRFVLTHAHAKSASVRYRICDLLHLLMKDIPATIEAHEDDLMVFSTMKKEIRKRLRDRVATVRRMAVYALHRLQDISGGGNDVLKDFLIIVREDQAKEVRKVIVDRLCFCDVTRQAIKERSRDVSSLVRCAVFDKLRTDKIHNYRPKELREILGCGLKDRDENVQEMCIRLLISWFESIQIENRRKKERKEKRKKKSKMVDEDEEEEEQEEEENERKKNKRRRVIDEDEEDEEEEEEDIREEYVLQEQPQQQPQQQQQQQRKKEVKDEEFTDVMDFLLLLGVDEDEDISELITLHLVSRDRSLISIRFPKKENLTNESVFFWKVLCKYFHHSSSVIGDTLTSLSRFGTPKTPKSQPSKAEHSRDNINPVVTLRTPSKLPLTDDGEAHLQTLFSSFRDIREYCELIIHHQGDANIFICKQLLEICCYLDYSDEFGRNVMLNLLSSMLSTFQYPDRYVNEIITALECVSSSAEVFTNTAVKEIEKLHQCARNSRSETESYGFIIRLLRILSRLLSKSYGIGKLIDVSHVQYLNRLMVIPNLQHKVPTIRALAILCLGQFCGLQSELSTKHAPYLFKTIDEVVSRRTVPLNSPIIKPLLSGLFDILFQHATSPYHLESGNDNSKELDFYNGLLYIYSNCPSSYGDIDEIDDDDEDDKSDDNEEQEQSDDENEEEEEEEDSDEDIRMSRKEEKRRQISKKKKIMMMKKKKKKKKKKIIDNISGYHGGLRTLVAEGCCKLLIRGRILGDRVRKHILLFLLMISFSPESEKYSKLKQILNNFFQLYPSSLSDQKDLGEIFIYALRYIMLSTNENPFSKIPILKGNGFGMFLLEITNPEWFKKKKKEEVDKKKKKKKKKKDKEEEKEKEEEEEEEKMIDEEELLNKIEEEEEEEEEENVHDEMIMDLCREMLCDGTSIKNLRILCRLLSHFQYSKNIIRELHHALGLIKPLLKHKTCERIIDDLRKEIKNTFQKMNIEGKQQFLKKKKKKKKIKKKNNNNKEKEKEETKKKEKDILIIGEEEEEEEDEGEDEITTDDEEYKIEIELTKKEAKEFTKILHEFEEERFEFMVSNPKMDEFYIHPEDEGDDDDEGDLEEKKDGGVDSDSDSDSEEDEDGVFDQDVVDTPKVIRIQDRIRRKKKRKKRRRERKKKKKKHKKHNRKGRLRTKGMIESSKKGKKRKRGLKDIEEEKMGGDVDVLLKRKKKRKVMSSDEHHRFSLLPDNILIDEGEQDDEDEDSEELIE